MHNISGRGTGAAWAYCRKERPGRETALVKQKYPSGIPLCAEETHNDKEILWRCNDEWLVSQV